MATRKLSISLPFYSPMLGVIPAMSLLAQLYLAIAYLLLHIKIKM
jgi:hypothetical protein